jgi:hypothetical protein
MLRTVNHAFDPRLCLAIAVLFVSSATLFAGPFGAMTTWQPVDEPAAQQQLSAWMDSIRLDRNQRAEVVRLWNTAGSANSDVPLLDRLAKSLTPVEPRITQMIDHCSNPDAKFDPQAFDWLHRDTVSPFVRDNMCLFYARWLVQRKLYDEALAWTDDIAPSAVIDPTALLFYRAVTFHQLVEIEDAHVTLAQLMEHEESLPRRYQQLAALMQKDLETVREDTLDHIARRMSDIHRRLALGNADQPVQEVENGVIESLDKLIKKLEDQQKQQSGQQSSAGGQPSSTPMQDSQLAPMRAAGKSDHRDVGDSSGWGNLPPREREQALQQIGREFPAHYREIIEAYFRALANEDPQNPSEPSPEP